MAALDLLAIPVRRTFASSRIAWGLPIWGTSAKVRASGGYPLSFTPISATNLESLLHSIYERNTVRTLLRITIPVEAGNAAVHDGRLPNIIAANMKKLKPEAAYFFPDGGQRCAMFVFDMKDSSETAKIGESFFSELNAAVEFFPVMNADDLKKGLEGA